MSPFRPARPQSLLPASIPSYSEAESTSWDPADTDGSRDQKSKLLRAYRVNSPRRSSIKSRNPSGKTSPELVHVGSPDASAITERSTNSRPEGWWSSDEVAGTTSDPATPDTHTQVEKARPETPDTNPQPEKQATPRRTSRLPMLQSGTGTGLGISSPPPSAIPSSVAAVKITTTSPPSSHKSRKSIDSLRSSAGEASFGEHGISFGIGGKGSVAEGVVSKELGAAQTLRALDANGSDASDSSKKKKAKQQTPRRY